MSLKFSMVLEAVDKVTAPARRVKASVAGMASGIRAWGQQVRKVSQDVQSGARSLEFYQTRARRLRQVALGSFFRAAGMEARRFSDNLRSGIRNLNLMGRAGNAAKSGIASLGSKMAGLAKWGAAGVGAAGGLALFDLFNTAGQFEQFQLMLNGQMGSESKGKAAMGWISQFAKETPFELDQVTQAFLTLKNAGIDPTKGALRAAGDAAAGTSQEIGQAAEAISDAVTGEFERLKQLGITTSTAGDKVTLSWVKNEKQFSKVVSKADKLGLAMAVATIWSDKFGGSTERQSKSLFGIINNLKDTWSNFLRMVADAGIFDKVKNKLTEWLARLDAMAKDGSLKAWAQKISDGLSAAFDWGVRLVQGVDWPAIGRGLAAGVQVMLKLVDLFGKAVDKYYQFQAYRAARLYENTENGWFTSDKEKSRARDSRRQIESQFGVQTETGRKEEERKNWRGKYWRRTLNGPDIPNGKGLSRVEVGGKTEIAVSFKGPITGKVVSNSARNAAVPHFVSLGRSMDGPI